MRVDRHSILVRVLILQGAGWLTLLVLVGAAVWAGTRQARAVEATSDDRLTRLLARQIDSLLAADLELVQRVAAVPRTSLDQQDVDRLSAAVAEAFHQSRHLALIRLFDRGGRMLLQHPATAWPAPPHASFVSSVLQSGGVIAYAPLEDPLRAHVFVPLRSRAGTVDLVAEALLYADSPALREVLTISRAGLVRAPQSDGTHAIRPLTAVPWGIEVSPSSRVSILAASPALVWSLGISLALAAVFAWGTARSVTRPLLSLMGAAEQMAGGDLSRPLPPMPDDEVGRLARALERLRTALRESLDTTARQRDELEQRVRDRTRDLEEMCRRLNDRDAWRGDMLRKVIFAQEEERRRVARGLHDDTCQALAAIGVRLESALSELGSTAWASGGRGAVRGQLLSLKSVVDRALADLHRVIYDLRPSVLDDLGLVAGIKWLADEHLRRTGVSVRCEVSGLNGRLPSDVELALFRVVQEALINIERHAAADAVLIQVSMTGDLLNIEIEDDGRGFEPVRQLEVNERGAGLGLLGMRERIELVGGSLLVSSAPGQGTRIVMTVPVEDRRQEAAS